MEESMKDFVIALVQHESPVRRKARNLAATIEWARRAKRRGAAFVLFPELSLSGHAGHPAAVKNAEPVPGGDAVKRLCEVARELDLYLCAGIAEDDCGIHYNTQFIVGPEGYIGKQRKIHPSLDEYCYFRGGTQLPVFELPFARVGIVICYDNSFPETSRCLAVRGAELICGPRASRFGKWTGESGARKALGDCKDQWRREQACRAHDNGTYVALCNTVGRSARGIRGVEANHAGGCMLFDPEGRLVAESQTKNLNEEMLVVKLSGEAVAARRCEQAFNLLTRKPEAYRALVELTQ
jgi:predicted amidohydrolase